MEKLVLVFFILQLHVKLFKLHPCLSCWLLFISGISLQQIIRGDGYTSSRPGHIMICSKKTDVLSLKPESGHTDTELYNTQDVYCYLKSGISASGFTQLGEIRFISSWHSTVSPGCARLVPAWGPLLARWCTTAYIHVFMENLLPQKTEICYINILQLI